MPSGSPVLNGEGLAVGLVTRREVVAGTLSGQSVVIAVSEAAIKTFLNQTGVAFKESEKAEVGPLQARAPGATTLSVGLICG